MTNHLRRIITAHKHGSPVGITSVCSANPFVIRAALAHAREHRYIACIESTGRQVNQDGGYAGMTPDRFARWVREIAKTESLDMKNLILGGDHLGPGAWRSENAEAAMAKACELVRQCVRAGYQKLHLDPSMPCQDDTHDGRPGLSLQTIADRTVLLCETAEQAAAKTPGTENRLTYVVGAEVPTPGGVPEDDASVRISSVRDVEQTVRCMREAFVKKGLADAWGRCVAVVVETGATFGPEKIYDYDSKKMTDLKALIRREKTLVYEAHSTDFQTRAALTDMVRDHFAILKVGPCLTFAVREVLFALAHTEREWLGGRKAVTLSQLPERMRELMHADQTHWQTHYSGDEAYLRYITVFGFSDRIRYFWSDPRSTAAIRQLFDNLTRYGIPLPLLSQYLPDQFEAVREGRTPSTPAGLVNNKLTNILDNYATACGEHASE